nr:uncharacterized protein LOC129532933 [Gorilla gorilla gorilla]
MPVPTSPAPLPLHLRLHRPHLCCLHLHPLTHTCATLARTCATLTHVCTALTCAALTCAPHLCLCPLTCSSLTCSCTTFTCAPHLHLHLTYATLTCAPPPAPVPPHPCLCSPHPCHSSPVPLSPMPVPFRTRACAPLTRACASLTRACAPLTRACASLTCAVPPSLALCPPHLCCALCLVAAPALVSPSLLVGFPIGCAAPWCAHGSESSSRELNPFLAPPSSSNYYSLSLPLHVSLPVLPKSDFCPPTLHPDVPLEDRVMLLKVVSPQRTPLPRDAPVTPSSGLSPPLAACPHLPMLSSLVLEAFCFMSPASPPEVVWLHRRSPSSCPHTAALPRPLPEAVPCSHLRELSSHVWEAVQRYNTRRKTKCRISALEPQTSPRPALLSHPSQVS